jgi:hypothetical protein
MVEHLSRNWGNWASVVGLMFSFLAFVFSRRASKAAQEARDSVYRRSLGEDMNGANRTAADIVRFVNIDRGEMAFLRTGDLLNEIGYLVARWNARLSATSQDNLRRSKQQLRSIHSLLAKGSVHDLPPHERVWLAQSCQNLNTIFSEEYGHAMKASERED